jgi:hypothetical protein
MTCHDARELYSALVDDALDAGERSAVEAHVAGCAECRRELERFRRTVALMQGAGPVRAPAGFVDRVLEAAAPTPWYRRLARVLFSPLGVKLPLEAAAMLLVAGTAVYVFQHSPELQQAARHEAPPAPPSEARRAPFSEAPPALSSAPTQAPVAPAPAPTAPPAAPPPPPSVSLPPGAGRVSPPETQPAPPAALGAKRAPAPPSGASSAGPPAPASDRSGSPPAPPQSGPAKPPAAANRARVESPRQDGAATGEGADQAPSVAKKVDEKSRDSSAAEGKPGESRPAESRTGEVRAKEAERGAEGKGKGGGARPERATESAAPPARERVLPSGLSDPPAGDRSGALAREDKSGTAPAAPPPATAPASPPAAAPAPRPMMKSAPAPASPPAGAGDARVLGRPQLRQETAAQAALAPGADVAVRLAVPDREAAFRALAELLARAGGRELSRRADGDADAVDVLVPRERYADFLQSLAQVGRLSLEREPGAMPVQVRVALRIVHGGG